MSGGEVFVLLKETGNWKFEKMASRIGRHRGARPGGGTVKSWAAGVVPQPKSRQAISDFIQEVSIDSVIANRWIIELDKAWTRDRWARVAKKKGNSTNSVVENVKKAIRADSRLKYLPALFEIDQALPFISSYVDLRIVPARNNQRHQELFETTITLAEKVARRRKESYAISSNPQEVLDKSEIRSALILGAPGSGKSSLLRRIALDIVNNQWQHFSLPLFVEARDYWSARQRDKDTDFLKFAVNKLFPYASSVDSILSRLKEAAEKNECNVALLIDGLDEIASDSDAIDSIYSEMRAIPNHIRWIATSRSTGLMQALNEDLRCEMVELDDESIERLIENWCDVALESDNTLNRKRLTAEIFGSTGPREMARNPFLLTAMCYLKSANLDHKLPARRIKIYESLIEKIATQAQRHHGDRNILSERALTELQNFCFYLYNNDSPKQIFSERDWFDYVDLSNHTNSIDFQRQILPGRLLTVWGELQPRYHFLHLSLQEHLIARALLNYPIEFALQLRFSPRWGTCFRFYAALLYQRGRIDDFKRLMRILAAERDLNQNSLLMMAEIFGDAGITDTQEWIDINIQELLCPTPLPSL